MNNKIADRKLTNRTALQEVIIHMWYNELGSKYIKKLINSMPDRCK
jgi:hypothetical protein